MTTWHWRSFAELTTQELYDILALREDVFMVEQQCDEPDLDYRDQQAMHLLGRQHNQLIAYVRLFQAGIRYPDAASFGRVVTARDARGQGLGKEAMSQTLHYFKKTGNNAPIKISAQLYLQKFYASYGFQAMGEPFDEAGIIHIYMQKPHD